MRGTGFYIFAGFPGMPISKCRPVKVTASLKNKDKTKLTWTDQKTDVFAEGIFDPQYRTSDCTVGWVTVLERLALKKSSNVKIFEAIQKPLKRNFREERRKSKGLRVLPYCFGSLVKLCRLNTKTPVV